MLAERDLDRDYLFPEAVRVIINETDPGYSPSHSLGEKYGQLVNEYVITPEWEGFPPPTLLRSQLTKGPYIYHFVLTLNNLLNGHELVDQEEYKGDPLRYHREYYWDVTQDEQNAALAFYVINAVDIDRELREEEKKELRKIFLLQSKRGRSLYWAVY